MGTTAPTITNTLQVPGTINSPQLGNLDKSGAICTYNMSAQSGSPSVTFAIQNFDTANATYSTIVISGAITAINTPTVIFARAGAQIASLPTGYVGAGIPLARYWRVQEVVTGAGTAATGKVGCVVVR
jgi:hypothetical protein